MAKDAKTGNTGKNLQKDKPAFFNDQLGENAGEGRLIKECKKEKKR